MRFRNAVFYAVSLSLAHTFFGHTAQAQQFTLPDGRAFLPPPPRAEEPAQQADLRAFEKTRGLKDKARWKLAQNDANLNPDHVIKDFSCAAGFNLDPAKLPAMVDLLTSLAQPVEQDVSNEKDFWKRRRPFVGTDKDICTAHSDGLDHSYAYPSGHTTWGWLTASILASALPDRATQIMQRGRIFGESRIVCGVHWKSDVQAGYMNGSAMFATLQEQPAFTQKMAKVRQELLALRNAKTEPDTKTCAVEQQAAQDIF
ncbi:MULTISPECIES: phosphatase PAP2 family protein [Acetobacter]|uniref:Acid phosphatase n=1 Tax=Acetobacter pomorum DM001 TaxID=945681 RepID=F1YW28_9PROT|nr:MULTISPECIES: phosphatase PAP2 family protein [Acetobacter]ATI13183.1 phosphatase PAP2 family protein [Acetobacter pomorum]AXC26703.1 phosphatase PAP2 family protein [Acetobacter sp. JWB]EGE47021.1 Acid phosphatase [Acetobacter pomorum DM001]KAA8420889.1 phosphatase PAP2 family protein [Acetobacter pomorum]KAA8438877.1 phosphatase PAP2 family protein [Acetobacter pomorum]